MNKHIKIIFVCIYIVLLVFQVLTTNIKSAYDFSAFEIDRQISRMNEYPPFVARMGYILEVKKEIQIVRKLESNFFTVIDFKEYFPSRIPYILSPFIFIGLYIFINERGERKLIFNSFLFSIIFLSVIGSHAKYGPILILFFFAIFIFLTIQKIFKFKYI